MTAQCQLPESLKILNQPHTIMQELLQELQALQTRLAQAGGGKIVITSQNFTIRLGAEHESTNRTPSCKSTTTT